MRAASSNGTEIVVRKARSFSHFSDSTRCNLVTDSDNNSLQTGFLSIAFLTYLADNLLLTICIPVVPNMLDTKYGSIAIGCVFSMKPLFQMLTFQVTAALVDHRGPKLPLFLGTCILVFSTVLFGYGLSLTDDLDTAYTYLLISRMLHGCASSFILNGGMSLIAMTHSNQSRHQATRYTVSAIGLGLLLGPPLGGLCAYFVHSWFACIPISIILFLSILIQLVHYNGGYITFISDNNDPSLSQETEIIFTTNAFGVTKYNAPLDVLYSSSFSSFFSIVFNWYICLAFNISILGSISMGMMEPLLPSYLRDTFAYNTWQQGCIVGLCTFIYIVSTMVYGKLCDHKLYPKYVIIFSGVVALAVGLCLFATVSLSSVVYTVIALVLLGTGIGAVEATTLPFLAEIIEVCICRAIIYCCHGHYYFGIFFFFFFFFFVVILNSSAYPHIILYMTYSSFLNSKTCCMQ